MLRSRIDQVPRGVWVASALVFLYAFTAVVLLALVHAANGQGILTEEEFAAGFKNPVFLSHRLQALDVDTNFGGQLFFWLGSKVVPDPGFFFARTWKVLAMGFLGPVCFLFLWHRVRCHAWVAFATALLVVLQPGIFAFSWYGSEYNLDLVLGVLALYLAMSPRRGLIMASGAVLGVAVITYGSGLAFVVPVGIAWGLRLLRSRDRRADGFTVGGAGVLTGGMLLLPVLWWTNSNRILLGGADTPPDVWENALDLVRGLFQGRPSYYYLTLDDPLVSVLAFSLLGLVVAAFEWRTWWPILTLLVGGAMVHVLAGGVPGIRRAGPVFLALTLLTACAAQWIVEAAGKARGKRVGVAAGAVMLAVAFGLSVPKYADDRGALATGEIPLPHLEQLPTQREADRIVRSEHPERAADSRGDRYFLVLPMLQVLRGDVDSDGGLWPLLHRRWQQDPVWCGEGKCDRPAGS